MDRELTEQAFLLLLDHLTKHAPLSGEYDERWDGWHICRITGGWNNLLYRARNGEADLAIKFTIRDERDRASREFAALTALNDAGLEVAPKPLLLNQTRYAQPVVVQTWLEGKVSTVPPQSNEEWLALLQHFVTIHSIAPSRIGSQLREAVLSARTAAQAKTLVHHQMSLLPSEALSIKARSLIRHIDELSFPEWHAPTSLCRSDPSIQNFINRPSAWASVDWENSGWSDPAFEIADLMMHPAYMDVSDTQWDWVIETYCDLLADHSTVVRVRSYRVILTAWWVVRMARYLHDFSQGKDKRLVAPPVDWQAKFQAKYEHYLSVAEGLCA